MSETIIQGQTSGLVTDYFNPETKILSTRTADLFISEDKSRGEDVCLWILREPLPLNSEVQSQFVKRLQALEGIEPPVSDLIGYAVDSEGKAFGVLSRLDGNTLTEGNPEFSEIERRFISCVELMARIHSASIVCGDICRNSFWLNRAGMVRFIGIMGACESNYEEGLKHYPDAVHYMAPEQKENQVVDLRCDVYALGVLGYLLFSGKLPNRDNENNIQSINAHNKNAPFWCDRIISIALSLNPDDRFDNAGVMLEAIRDAREDFAENPDKALSHEGKGSFRDKDRTLASSSTLRQAVSERLPTISKAIFIKVVVAAAIAAVLVMVIWPTYQSFSKTAKLSHALSAHKAVAGDSIREAIDHLLTTGASSEQKKFFIQQIADSDDPVAHAVLVAISTNSGFPDIRVACENAILERAKRTSLIRSAEVVAGWINQERQNGVISGYAEDVLLTLDSTLPVDSRSSGLRRIYAQNSVLALMLGAAFSLDSSNIEDYQPLMAQLVGDRFKISGLADRSTLALILSTQILAENFGSEAIDLRDKIPDGDVLWVLGQLAERDDTQIQYIAELALERSLVMPHRRLFLEIIRDRLDLPADVLESLANAALGNIKAEDIGSFGRWYDNSIENILLLLSATESDPDILYEVFDTLASRTILNKVAASLVEWVKKNYWDTRLEFIKSIAVLSLSDDATISDLQGALLVFDRYIVDRDLLSALINVDKPKMIAVVIDRYKEVIPPSHLLTLLLSPQQEVKLSAIKALQKSNDVGALRVIIERYEQEQDPVVKKAYEENFWVVKQRLADKGL